MKIMISGPDGVGKSTIIKELKAEAQLKSIDVKVSWMRFGHFFAKIINGLGRVLGKSYYETYPWGKIGYHKYKGWFGYLYSFAIYLDYNIILNFKKQKILLEAESWVIFDRYIIDIVADLIVDIENSSFPLKLFNTALKKELDVFEAYIFVCQKDIVEKRRVDIKDDKFYEKKIAAYKVISQSFRQINMIDTGKLKIEEIVQIVIK